MEKILKVSYAYGSIHGGDSLGDVQSLLNQGWTTKMIVPYAQYVSISTAGNAAVCENLKGDYGITVILEKN